MITNHPHFKAIKKMHIINITRMVAQLFLMTTIFSLGCGGTSQVADNEANQDSDNNHREANHDNGEVLNNSENHTNSLNNSTSNSDINSQTNNSELLECKLDLEPDECEARGCHVVRSYWVDWNNKNEERCTFDEYQHHRFCFPLSGISENAVRARYARLEEDEWKVYSFPSPIVGKHEEFIPCSDEWEDGPKPRECDC